MGSSRESFNHTVIPPLFQVSLGPLSYPCTKVSIINLIAILYIFSMFSVYLSSSVVFTAVRKGFSIFWKKKYQNKWWTKCMVSSTMYNVGAIPKFPYCIILAKSSESTSRSSEYFMWKSKSKHRYIWQTVLKYIIKCAQPKMFTANRTTY